MRGHGRGGAAEDPSGSGGVQVEMDPIGFGLALGRIGGPGGGWGEFGGAAEEWRNGEVRDGGGTHDMRGFGFGLGLWIDDVGRLILMDGNYVYRLK